MNCEHPVYEILSLKALVDETKVTVSARCNFCGEICEVDVSLQGMIVAEVEETEETEEM